MSDEQLTQLRLSLVVVNVDLQLYKGSIYKQRWGTPGGNDHALPCYSEAIRVMGEATWPAELQPQADDLVTRIGKFKEVLAARDVTLASSEQTRMTRAYEALRESVRTWPSGSPKAAADQQPGDREQGAVHSGMEAPGT